VNLSYNIGLIYCRLKMTSNLIEGTKPNPVTITKLLKVAKMEDVVHLPIAVLKKVAILIFGIRIMMKIILRYNFPTL